MLFNSLTFVAFFAVVLAAYQLRWGWTPRKVTLLVASYLFYAAWNPPFVALLAVSTVVDWFVAKAMARSQSKRHVLLFCSLLTNLGLLAYFKYGGFILENFTVLVRTWAPDYAPQASDIVLPVGISFYTFQTLSYSIDVFRGKMQPARSFVDFALFVSFFPQLVAGPIVRASDFLPQCEEERFTHARLLSWGLVLFVIGLFQKVVLADAVFGPIADRVYERAAGCGFADAWLGTLAFSGQIFCDFAGYSTCAIGIALTLGFALPDNFRYPYAAIGFSDFWRRWHISLSTWLRDYLYIPLGGSRRGAVRTYVNLALTMLIGGLWHGASWRFVVWGGLHGAYLTVERLLRRRRSTKTTRGSGGLLLGVLATYALVCLTWVFFRATSWSDAASLIRAMILPQELGLRFIGARGALMLLAATAALISYHIYMRERTIEQVWIERRPWMRALVLALLLAAIVAAPGNERAFIYFQF